jgi:hypothetical protein
MSITVEQIGGLSQIGFDPNILPGFQTKVTPGGGLVISRLVVGTLAPSQTVVVPVGVLNVKPGVTVTVRVAVPVQVPALPVTVYVVVVVGLAVTLAPVVALNPVGGAQV